MNERPTSAFPAEGPDAQYRAFLAAGEFRIQRCTRCAGHVYYPRIICPHCGASELDWVSPSGVATVYSTSVVRASEPYNIALVDLAEGPRLITRVVDMPPEDVHIGMTVEAFVGAVDDTPVVLFRPAQGEPA